MATIEKRTAIVLPTAIVKGIMCALSTDKNRAMLNAFLVQGDAFDNSDGGRHYDLTLVATDSCEMVELHYSYDLGCGEPIDVDNGFGWVVKPTDKLTGSDPWCRIERIEDERGDVSYNVRTYKAATRNLALARGMAIADMQPASYHVWGTVDGKYPSYERLYASSLTTVGNVSINPEIYSKVDKALTTAFGTSYGITLCGIGTGTNAAIEYAMYDDGGERIARAIIMPMRKRDGSCYADKGTVSGIDPTEHKALQERYDAQCEISAKLRDEVDALKGNVVTVDEYNDLVKKYYDAIHEVEVLESKLASVCDENADLRNAWQSLANAAYSEDGALMPTPEQTPEPMPTQTPEPTPEPEPVEIETPDERNEKPESESTEDTATECVPTTPAPVSDFWVPDGCTVAAPNSIGNVWLDGPAAVLKKCEAALKKAGWKLAKQRQAKGLPYWYRKVAVA